MSVAVRALTHQCRNAAEYSVKIFKRLADGDTVRA
jgi:hypothetical protein